MDVRCEKCETEYELDESKVTEAGVTVKCTSCGNLFKIRRRSTANQPLPPLEAMPNDKVWLVRSPTGDIRKFRELTQLQQWIIERRVSRDCEISRTGEAWKRLGDIGELSSFFAVVEQASAALKAQAVTRGKSTLIVPPPHVPPAGSQGSPSRPPPPPSGPGGPNSNPPPMLGAQTGMPAFLDEPRSGRPSSGGGEGMYRQAAASGPQVDPLELARSTASSGEPVWAGRGERMRLPEGAVTTGGWRGQPTARPGGLDDGPEMELSTKKFPASRIAPLTEPNRFGHVRTASDTFDPDAVLDEIGARRSRVPHVVAAIILCGGASFGVWWFGLRERPSSATAGMTPSQGVAIDAGGAAVKPTVTSMALDAAPVAAGSQPASHPVIAADQPYRDAIAKLTDDTDESLAAADKLLETAHVADPAAEAKVLAAQALVASSRAQSLMDDADSATDARKAAEARAEAGRQLTRAEKLARDAQAKSAATPEALVAMSDVERQKKVPAAEIEKRLAPAGDRADALYERGMLRWRDGKAAEAEALFTRAVDAQAREMPGTTHLRARYRLAVLALAAKHYDSAKAQLDAILAAQPAHARAKALAARVAQAQNPGPAQPPPPSPIPGTDKLPPGNEPGPPTPPSGGAGAAADYAGQIAKANKLAENGDCNGAIKIFERALDARPSGVEALTGLGYCFLDKKNFPEALSSFRAALGISPRYTEALLGMGDTYRNEGMKAEAVDYYKRYLEVDPGGSRATTSRRYIEEFEATTGEPATNDNTPPPPKPTPTPAPPADKPRDMEPLPSDKLPDKPGESDDKPKGPAPPAPDPVPAEPVTP